MNVVDPTELGSKPITPETEEAPLGVEAEPVKVTGPDERLTRVITLNPLAGAAAEVHAGLTQMLKDLAFDMQQNPGMLIRFEMGEPLSGDEGAEDSKDNDLAKALDEQKDTQTAGTVRVNDFAQAVQTAMRKNGVKNCAWVVIVPPAKDAKEGTPESQPRFMTGGSERTHNWFKESLELAASVRMMMAQKQAAGMEGLKQLQSGLVVPDDKVVTGPPRPPLVIVPG